MAENAILQILKCPLCSSYMSLPIYICCAGHSACNECKKTGRKCPTCNSSFNSKRRNYSLEQISTILSFPCRYEGNGCTELMKYVNLDNHTKICSYRPQECMLNQILKCTFNGPAVALKKHIQEQHPMYCWMGETKTANWNRTSPTVEVQAVFCYNEMFYFHRQHVKASRCGPGDPRNNYIYWACQYIGKSENAANFTYTVTIDDGTGRKYSFHDQCQNDLYNVHGIIASKHCFAINIPVLESYMDPEQKVSYSMTIDIA